MMNLDADRQPLRRVGLVLAALVLALLMALASCGPGVVGTGTGAPVPSAAAAVCGAEFASSLSCAGTTDGNGASAGTAPVEWSDAVSGGPGATVVVRLTGNQLELEQPCAQLRFEGTWSVLDDGRRAFAGTYTDRESVAPRPGFVTVTPDVQDARLLTLELFDAEGVLRHGPWVVRRGEGEVSVAACAAASARAVVDRSQIAR